MRSLAFSLLASLTFLPATQADPAAGASLPPQLRAGEAALAQGDNTAAVQFFTQSLLYGSLGRKERETAYAKRAEAFLALGRADEAAADSRRALALDPGDTAAASVRDRAVPPLAATTQPAPPASAADPSAALNAKVTSNLEAVESRNKAAADKYQADLADYEAQKAAIAAKAQADQRAYAARLAAHDAEVQALKDQYAAAMADWRARVKACGEGHTAQCGP